MPTYEYACRGCGEHLEVVQSFKDDALTTCPSCQGELRKVFSAAGIIFKGSGWHVKDYASKSTSTTAAGGDAASGDAASGDSSGSDGSASKEKGSTAASKGSDASSGSSGSAEKSA